MAIRISGPGVGLPIPQELHPESHLRPFTPPTNRVWLQAGQVLTIPAGNWLVECPGVASVIQYLDPVTQEWQPLTKLETPPSYHGIMLYSDGFNYRVLNTAQVGTEAQVTAPGSGYVQATTTVTPSAGNSVWRPIIGGALGNLTLTAAGRGYSIPPLVVIPSPPPPGRVARAFATLAADGTVASLTMVQPGAGYKRPPHIFLLASANDHLDEIVTATARVELVGEGTVTSVLLEEFGAPLPAAPTLTISGSGTGAAASVLPTTWLAPVQELVGLQGAAG